MQQLRAFVFVLLCLLTACSKAIKDLPPQNWQGYEVKVLSVEAKSSPFTMKDQPTNLTCSASEGLELIVAEIAFKSQSRENTARIVRLELEDTAGKRYEDFGFAMLDPSKASEFCFENVPKGAELKTLRVEGLIFDLR